MTTASSTAVRSVNTTASASSSEYFSNCPQLIRAVWSVITAAFGKIGRVAVQELDIELVQRKCLPISLYGLECCPLNKSAMKSLDLTVTWFWWDH